MCGPGALWSQQVCASLCQHLRGRGIALLHRGPNLMFWRVEFSLALSAFICLGTNIVGYLIAVATKTHKITDLIVRSSPAIVSPSPLDRDTVPAHRFTVAL